MNEFKFDVKTFFIYFRSNYCGLSLTNQAKIIKLKKTVMMKKIVLTGIVGVFVLGVTSCGGGHTCDAYREADFTKYKAEKTQKVESPVISMQSKLK